MQTLLINYLKPFHGNKIILQVFLGIIVISLSLVFFGLSLGKPYMGTVISQGPQGWFVESVDSGGIANSAGITSGDKPVVINGIDAEVYLEEYEDYTVVFGPKFKDLVVIDNNGNTKSAVLNGELVPWQTITEQISWLVLSLIFWVTGIYVLFKRPKSTAANLLFLSGLSLGLLLSANIASAIDIPTAMVFQVAALSISPWILFHFFIVLPDERSGARHNPWIYLIYVLPVITIILFPIIGYANGQPVEFFRLIRMLEAGIGMLATAVIIIINYVTAISIRTRQQMKIILFSCLIALIPLIALNVLPAIIVAKQTTGISLLFLIFIPIGLGYAVVKQQLMDIDFIIRRGIVYTLVTLIIAAILTVIIFLVLGSQSRLSITQDILLAVILGGAATLLFVPVRKGIETIIDKFFYKDRHDYRKTIEILSNSLKSIDNFTDVSRVIVGTLNRTLNLAGTCLFISKEDYYEVAVAQGIFTDVQYQSQLTAAISQSKQKDLFPNMASRIDSRISFLVPLTFEEKELGIICLSNKASMQRFSSGDIYLIQGIASIAAISLHSAVLARDVNMKTTFVSVASHEIRTPLTAIMGYAELMIRHEPSETNRKRLKIILDNGQKLSNMANELLNVSRIQSDKVILKLETLKLTDIILEQVDMTKELTKKHEFIIEANGNLPDIIADHDKLGQVLMNLLGNAVKYSPDGGRITISACHDSIQNNIKVSIKDEGIGISSEDKASLFTTFHRIQRPETQSIRGSGLGLFIAKEWVTAMGGKSGLRASLIKARRSFSQSRHKLSRREMLFEANGRGGFTH